MTEALKVVTQRLRETEIVVARSAANIDVVLEAVRLQRSSARDPQAKNFQTLAETRNRLAERLRASLDEEKRAAS